MCSNRGVVFLLLFGEDVKPGLPFALPGFPSSLPSLPFALPGFASSPTFFGSVFGLWCYFSVIAGNKIKKGRRQDVCPIFECWFWVFVMILRILNVEKLLRL